MLSAIASLHPEHFRALIRRHGQPVEWWSALPCSCQASGDSDNSRGCGNCSQGQIYTHRALAPEVRVYLDKTTRRINDAELGLIPSGTATLAGMPDEILPGFADKFYFPLMAARHADTYRRGEGASDSLKRGGAFSLLSVMQGNRPFALGTDCTLSGDELIWTPGGDAPAGDAPAEGEFYSVVHMYHPTYWYLGELQQEAMPAQPGGFLPFLGALAVKQPFAGDDVGIEGSEYV